MFKKREKKGNIRVVKEDTPIPSVLKLEKSESNEKELTANEIKHKKVFTDINKEERKRKLFDATALETDFNPMICRPFYETGYCGFGDNCIYRHDREEIIHSYELKMETIGPLDDNEYCFGCKRDISSLLMMIMSCKHEFCKECAVKSVASKKCLKCKKPVEPSIRPVKRKAIEQAKTGKKKKFTPN